MSSNQNDYLEYLSIVFFVCSFLYFSKVCYIKYSNYHLKSISRNSLINYDIYLDILSKYDAKVLNIQSIHGNVEACIEKNEFKYDSFMQNEKFLIEERENCFLIIFKNVRELVSASDNGDFTVKKELSDVRSNVLKIDSIYFIDKNRWNVVINGQVFDRNNRKIDDNNVIGMVNEDAVEIISHGKKKLLYI